MKADLPLDFPTRIKQLRAKYNLTQSQLANLMQVSFASVNRWENGQARPSSLAWQQILRAETLGLAALTPNASQQTTLVREAQAPYGVTQDAVPDTDFSADPEIVRAVAEGERLQYGYLFNPMFATEISMIDPLPHQRIAVYDHMLTQSRLRCLLADDAGAGKTIMSGLYLCEMLARRLIRRILIIPPAGLVGNWERELRTLFNLRFRIVTGSDARTENPFIGLASNHLIVSLDTLAGTRMFSRLKEPGVQPYDLVIFDEAHKLSADRDPDLTIRKTGRYRLAEALAGIDTGDDQWQLPWRCHHLLLLTATPHMGKDFPYYSLWRLLEPEALPTLDAFNAYPADARQRHFIRRTKEEMITLDGTPLYPTRISDTVSYDLTQGAISEQTLYDETTNYIQYVYNRARILNRSAARFAMSIFQRRLASSTYALMQSFKRRLAKLNALIDDIQSGRITIAELNARQSRLEVHDVFAEKTADEEENEAGREENELAEDQATGSIVATSLAELQTERTQVEWLLGLAQQVYDSGEGSKFEKLYDLLRAPEYAGEKFIVFTEHRDTLDFLVQRLEGRGFTDKVASIHGGMDYRQREEQIELFRRPLDQGGAQYLIATDAAGEGINLQFCWLMLNYDIPWNPARLEQRMGRIHRYKQTHDPVIILNLVAAKTREGRVLHVLLDKLERIRRELGSDKVFDVVGRLLQGISLREYMEQAITEEGASAAERTIAGSLTKAQVKAIQEREQRLYGDGGDVRSQLPRLQASIARETYYWLLPGYVRRFIEKATPLLGIGIEGDLNTTFSFKAIVPGALDPLWPLLESYPPQQRDHLTVFKPEEGRPALFMHPGEPVFDLLRGYFCQRYTDAALKGAVFVDPTITQPLLFHLALVTISRKADPSLPVLQHEEIVEQRLVGFKQSESGTIEACPVEYLLLLKGGHGIPAAAIPLVATSVAAREQIKAYATAHTAEALAEQHRQALLQNLAERETFIRNGYSYQEADLAAIRAKLGEKARAGDPRARGELTKIREQQRRLAERREESIAALRREPELIVPDEVTFLAHALIVPSSDPEDRKRYDAAVEAIAVKTAWAHEVAHGAVVRDVSTAALARAAGLPDWPGFDLLSTRPAAEERAIEVKGRATTGDIELTENEWTKACNLRERYWLYVVLDCASDYPRLLRINDPFSKLIIRNKRSVLIDDRDLFDAAETD